MSGRKHSLADKTLDRFAFYATYLQYIRPGVLLAHRLSALTPKCGDTHRVSQVFLTTGSVAALEVPSGGPYLSYGKAELCCLQVPTICFPLALASATSLTCLTLAASTSS